MNVPFSNDTGPIPSVSSIFNWKCGAAQLTLSQETIIFYIHINTYKNKKDPIKENYISEEKMHLP